MSALRDITRHWFLQRIDPTIRIGRMLLYSGLKSQDPLRAGLGASVLLYRIAQRRRVKELVYETSLNVDQGMTIRVKQGRRVIAESTPLP